VGRRELAAKKALTKAAKAVKARKRELKLNRGEVLPQTDPVCVKLTEAKDKLALIQAGKAASKSKKKKKTEDDKATKPNPPPPTQPENPEEHDENIADTDEGDASHGAAAIGASSNKPKRVSKKKTSLSSATPKSGGQK